MRFFFYCNPLPVRNPYDRRARWSFFFCGALKSFCCKFLTVRLAGLMVFAVFGFSIALVNVCTKGIWVVIYTYKHTVSHTSLSYMALWYFPWASFKLHNLIFFVCVRRGRVPTVDQYFRFFFGFLMLQTVTADFFFVSFASAPLNYGHNEI